MATHSRWVEVLVRTSNRERWKVHLPVNDNPEDPRVVRDALLIAIDTMLGGDIYERERQE